MARATVEFGHAAVHRVAILRFRNSSRKCFYPDTPSDVRRGALNCLADIRRLLRELGAERQQVQKSTRERTKRQRRHKAVRPGDAVVREDRWIAPLSAMLESMT